MSEAVPFGESVEFQIEGPNVWTLDENLASPCLTVNEQVRESQFGVARDVAADSGFHFVSLRPIGGHVCGLAASYVRCSIKRDGQPRLLAYVGGTCNSVPQVLWVDLRRAV